jgi:hypothetical protein
MTRKDLVFALGLLLSALPSCAREHLTETHGRAFNAAFAAQAPAPATPRKATSGLDSQEASIISGSYFRSLAPKSANDVKDQPILLLAPPGANGGQPAVLAPSVPPSK